MIPNQILKESKGFYPGKKNQTEKNIRLKSRHPRKMKPKERIRAAFNHKEPDRVPISALTVNSPPASEILEREAWTGIGARQATRRFEILRKGGNVIEFYRRRAKDEVALYRKMGLDAYFMGGMIPKENQAPP
ncbi:hypothetical protein AKJ65_02105 [candidate division MSBL1 archaeon SCGC-AAA259E19]|uniref:Uncharacterized protein n=1 Tax=candidate division MSBL1 archaeon SCGC-AAA259E19 TaxID=1698264 RepID=A0A133UM38_9EURY|nr:hypothetical protein AKJ65_02105 [candidate division MSBL1 archaeon SCGC-AAA259E19]